MMLEFKQNDTSATLILTLTEAISLVAPNYLFTFTHILTRDVVAFVLGQADDQSTHQNRYNKFVINPSVLFNGFQSGEWHYKIYEQVSASNLDPNLSGASIEVGKLFLARAVGFTYTEYDTTTTFKAYNG